MYPKEKRTALAICSLETFIASKTGLESLREEQADPVDIYRPFSLNERTKTSDGMPSKAA